MRSSAGLVPAQASRAFMKATEIPLRATQFGIGRAPAFLRQQGVVPVCLVVVMLAGAFSVVFKTASGLEWPGTNIELPAIDLYRDIASAQTILDSGYGPDPAYLGERTWYNPLTPSLIAFVSRVSGWPVPKVAAQIGIYANLLAPVALFLMCAILFDRWVALFATAGFLFVISSSLPSWVGPSYSPWMLPVSFVQSLFYLSVVVLHRAMGAQRLVAFVPVGLMWGLTFLGHTAPALILGGIITMVTILALVRPMPGTSRSLIVTRWALLILIALIVSSPFAFNIVGAYGLRIQNPVPPAYSEPLLSRQLPTLIGSHLNVATLVVIVGAVTLIRQRPSRASVVMISWIAVALLLLFYTYVRLAAKLIGLQLPSIVPSFHYFFYLKAATAVLFGIGMVAVGEIIARGLAGVRDAAVPPDRARAIAAGGCLLMVISYLPTYLTHSDFSTSRRDALATMATDTPRFWSWLRCYVGPNDVILANNQDAATIVTAAGSKTVVMWVGFSNPYVPYGPRADARTRMYAALDTGDVETFKALAREYQVTYVLTSGDRSERFARTAPDGLRLALAGSDRRLYKVDPPVVASPAVSASAHGSACGSVSPSSGP